MGSSHKQDATMKIIALLLIFVVQDSFAGNALPVVLGAVGTLVKGMITVIPALKKGRKLQAPAAVLDDAAIRAMEAVCQCEAPIPQYVNALYTAGQSCMNIGRDIYDEAECVATELGLLNDDGEFLEVTPADLFTAAHGGSEAMDNALDSCYSNAFDNVEDVVMASMTFGTCMEYAVANMCGIEIPDSLQFRSVEMNHLVIGEAASRNMC